MLLELINPSMKREGKRVEIMKKMEKMDGGACGCCGGSGYSTMPWLQLIVGVLLILIGAQWLWQGSEWIIIGLYFALKGIIKMM